MGPKRTPVTPAPKMHTRSVGNPGVIIKTEPGLESAKTSPVWKPGSTKKDTVKEDLGMISSRSMTVPDVAYVSTGPFLPADMGGWLPAAVVASVRRSITREEFEHKGRQLVGVIGVKLFNLSDDFIRAMLGEIAPTRPGVVDAASELAFFRGLTKEFQALLSSPHERLARVFLDSEAGVAWLERLKASIRGKHGRDDVTVQELEEFFQFEPQEIALIWCAVVKYMEASAKDHRQPSGRDWMAGFQRITLSIIGRYCVLMTPKGNVNPSITVSARTKTLNQFSAVTKVGWPAIIKSLDKPRSVTEWAAEMVTFESVDDHPEQWNALLRRFGWQEKEAVDDMIETADGANRDGMDAEDGNPDSTDADDRNEREKSSQTELGEGEGEGGAGGDGDDAYQSEDEGTREVDSPNDWETAARLGNSVEMVPMEVGEEFNDGGDEGWVSQDVLAEIVATDVDDREYDQDTARIVRGILVDRAAWLEDYVPDEAIRVACLGPFARARYFLEELTTVQSACDEIAIRMANKKEAAEDMKERIFYEVKKMEENMTFLRGLKEDTRKAQKSVVNMRREAAVKPGIRQGLAASVGGATKRPWASGGVVQSEVARKRFMSGASGTSMSSKGIGSMMARTSASAAASVLGGVGDGRPKTEGPKSEPGKIEVPRTMAAKASAPADDEDTLNN